jgi:hypothetical protein
VLFGTGPLAAGAFDLDGLVVTPVIEELLKVAAVALAFRWVRPSLRAGIVLGAAAGVGMTLLETAHWITVSAILAAGADDWAIVALRFALAGFGLHATTTAISGGALGAWLGRGGHRVGRPGLVVAGLVVAMAIHGAWNAWAPGLIDAAVAPTLAAGRRPAPFDLFITASAVAAVLLAVPYLVLAIAWLRGRPSPRSDAPGATSGIEPADGVSDGEPGGEPGEPGDEPDGEPGEGPEPGPAS